MKKIVFSLLVFVALSVVSCSTPAEKSIKELEAIVVKVETGCVDTEKEFEEVLQSIELLTEKYKDVEYTAGQQSEIEDLNMRLSAALTEQFGRYLGSAFSGMMKGLMGGMKGFVNGMHDFVDEMQYLIDDIEELADDIENM